MPWDSERDRFVADRAVPNNSLPQWGLQVLDGPLYLVRANSSHEAGEIFTRIFPGIKPASIKQAHELKG